MAERENRREYAVVSKHAATSPFSFEKRRVVCVNFEVSSLSWRQSHA